MLFVVSGVRADEPVEPIRVVYAAVDPGCPTEGSFVAEIRARTSRAEIVREGERRTFTVDLTASPGKPAHGKLTLTSGDRTSVREVEGTTCAEVASALALIAALAVDPRASTKPAEELAPTPEPAPEPERAPDVTPTPPIVAPPPAPREAPAPPPPEPERPRVWSAIGPVFALRTGVQPSASPTYGGFVALGLRRSQVFGPVAFVSGSVATRQTDGAGSFAWSTGRLDLCPVHLAYASRARTSACGSFEIGALSARGENLTDAQDETRLWLAAGGALRTTWDISRIVFLEGGVSLLVPLRRDRFYADPGATLFEVPALGLGVGLGIGILLFS